MQQSIILPSMFLSPIQFHSKQLQSNPNPVVLLSDPLSTIGGLFRWRSPINGPQYAVRIFCFAISTVLDEPICCVLRERICSPGSWCHPEQLHTTAVQIVRTPKPLVSAVLPLFLFWLLPHFNIYNLHTQSDGMDRLAFWIFLAQDGSWSFFYFFQMAAPEIKDLYHGFGNACNR